MAPKRLLVANRGEIAIRILSTARELGLYTIAIYTSGDSSHTAHAHEAVQLPKAATYLDVPYLVSVCRKHRVDLVHPGYGFLSESDEFCSKLHEAGVTFVGPSAEILRKTGDKLSARRLAEECDVPVLPALTEPTDNVSKIVEFAKKSGMPVMIKAADGGGGRGIRLVHKEKDLESNLQRAINESPSRKVFAEKAAIGGYRHVEVQILGDGQTVRHYWERECSIQRRFQKVVEIAPSVIPDRKLLSSVISSAVRMAKHINYKYLGTWEFLVSPSASSYHFMEINPRLQVEHTITETICGTDLVRWQLLIAQGATLNDLSIPLPSPEDPPPPSTAIQLRLTAEDPRHNFSLSIGRINSASLPGGNGVRTDTHTRAGVVVSADFDSLLAKLIIGSSSWDACVDKCARALDDVRVEGIATNADLLRGIVLSPDFCDGKCDTQWLEAHLGAILERGAKGRAGLVGAGPGADSAQPARPKAASGGGGGPSIQKGDAFDVRLEGPGTDGRWEETLTVARLLRNDFPAALAVELAPGGGGGGDGKDPKQRYTLQLSRSEGVQNRASGRQGNPKDPSHLICPLAGQLVEMLVDEGDAVDEWEPVAIVRQMKMELEVRAQRKGVVKGLWEVEEGDDVGQGMLVCEVVPDEGKGKL